MLHKHKNIKRDKILFVSVIRGTSISSFSISNLEAHSLNSLRIVAEKN
jgi:hypothetical protein